MLENIRIRALHAIGVVSIAGCCALAACSVGDEVDDDQPLEEAPYRCREDICELPWSPQSCAVGGYAQLYAEEWHSWGTVVDSSCDAHNLWATADWVCRTACIEVGAGADFAGPEPGVGYCHVSASGDSTTIFNHRYDCSELQWVQW